MTALRPRAGGARAACSAAAATATIAARVVLARRPPGERHRWRRRNHAGRTVSLLGGPAAVVGLLAAAASGDPALRGPGLLAVVAAGSAGLYDDLYGATHARGLSGHLRALRDKEVTSGLGKLVAISAGAAASARLLSPAGAVRRAPSFATRVDQASGAALIAGAANLANLFDLRPGRTLKLTLACSVPAACGTHAASATAAGLAGVTIASLPADLAEQTMLGDCGANALGALLGVLAAAGRRRTRGRWLATVLAGTLASEAVSFSAAIDAVPALRWLDRLGRRT
jgi:UDP-N-acetylmuramyl pentapeptide phosphotransferase/UDP-N-acetylglucosamine-1-phosphate transferase